MENRPETQEPEEPEPRTEWERPTVEEFDVSSTTMSSASLIGTDGATYS